METIDLATLCDFLGVALLNPVLFDHREAPQFDSGLGWLAE